MVVKLVHTVIADRTVAAPGTPRRALAFTSAMEFAQFFAAWPALHCTVVRIAQFRHGERAEQETTPFAGRVGAQQTCSGEACSGCRWYTTWWSLRSR